MNGPAYFDLQVNGYAGVDFNQDDLTSDGLHHACERLRSDGVSGILATVITEKLPVMQSRLERLAALREEDPLAQELIAGFHVEGPFISPLDGFRGAHPEDSVLPATPDDANRLLDSGQGLVRLFTLAPEQDAGLKTTKMLVERGVVVSAGHCDPTIEQLDAAIDGGVSMFTHLGNGCPMMLHRHENVIQRVLSRSDRLHLCFIADGAHVPFAALKNYLRAAGIDRCSVVTDATAAAGMGPGHYRLGRWDVDVGEDLVAWSPDGSHLIGSAVTMVQAAANLREQLGLTESEVHLLTSKNPRVALNTSVN